jgi:hypothetical protein
MVDHRLGMVNKVKELPIESMPWDRKGTAPIIHVGIHTYSTSNALYKWRTRLFAGVKDKKPAPLLATSGEVQENSASR